MLVGKDTPFQYQEAFKSLRTNLKFLAMGKSCKKIIMTSAIPGEGKSSVSINLAVSLAEAGSNAFTMSPSRWVELTGAVGILSKNGAGGGTYAQRDIAFKFASWVSVEFELYLVKEFQRLKEQEQALLGWSAKRELSKINYHIHTDAIKQNLIPAEVTAQQASRIYASEADVLNVALFGMTALEWRDAYPDLKGNIRDYAGVNELICLSNMESLNAVLINEGLSQRERLVKLNRIAIQQMRILEDTNRKLLK